MKLYTYWRSTSSYRVRIALALKGIEAEHVFVNLLAGAQRSDAYRAVNAQARVPALMLEDGTVLTQSPAIIDYLDEAYPQPPLLPPDSVARAQVRAVAALIGCDIHPLHNLSPLTFLRQELSCSEPDVARWISRWIGNGLDGVERLIGDNGFCFGPEPGLADLFLLPQLYAARRFGIPLETYRRILRVETCALEHPAFQAAHPDRQFDAMQRHS